MQVVPKTYSKKLYTLFNQNKQFSIHLLSFVLNVGG